MVGTVDDLNKYLENCPNALPDTDWFQGVVVFYGFYDFTSLEGYTGRDVNSLEDFWGAEFSEIPIEKLIEMSPMSWVDGSEPPFLLIHGTLDTDVPSWMSEEFAVVLQGAGVQVDLFFPEAKHAFILEPFDNPVQVQSLQVIEAFLARLFEE